MSLMSFCIIVCRRDPRRQWHKSWKVQNTCSVNWFLSLPALFPVCTTSEDVIKLKSLATIRHFVIIILPISSSLPPTPFAVLAADTTPPRWTYRIKEKLLRFRGGCRGNTETETQIAALLYRKKLSFRNCTRDLPISAYMQLDTSENEAAVESASRSFRQSYRRQRASGGTHPLLLYRQCRRSVADV